MSSPEPVIIDDFTEARDAPSEVHGAEARSAAAALPATRVVRGLREVVVLQGLLSEIGGLSGQRHEAADLAYFLGTPKALRKTPYLLLTQAGRGDASVQGYKGAVVLFEYRNPGCGTRVYATSDPTGRRNVFAPREERAAFAANAARTLLECGAQIVHVAYQEACADAVAEAEGPRPPSIAATEAVMEALAGRMRGSGHWTMVEQRVPLYLPIEASFDATLARLGKVTRRNLRAYRRLAERDLGCVFVPEVGMGVEELLAFNRQCVYQVPDALVAWRHRALSIVGGPMFCGIREGNGRWLSLIGGRRNGTEIEVDWQMNRRDMPKYSLSTAMRSWLIGYEVERGSTRLYLEGGSQHAMTRSFVHGRVVELTVKRRSPYARLLERYGHRLFPPDNYVGQILRDGSYVWREW